MRHLTRASKGIELEQSDRLGLTFKGLRLSLRKGGHKAATVRPAIHLTVQQLKDLVQAYINIFGPHSENAETIRLAVKWFAEDGVHEALANFYASLTDDSAGGDK